MTTNKASEDQKTIKYYMRLEDQGDTPAESETPNRGTKRSLMSNSPADTVEAYQMATGSQFDMIMEKLGKLDDIHRLQSETKQKLESLEQVISGVANRVTSLENNVDGIKQQGKQVNSDLLEMQKNLEFSSNEISDLKSQMDELKLDDILVSKEAKKDEDKLRLEQTKSVHRESMQMREYTQRNNIIISGVPETNRDENCVQLVDDFLYQYLWLDVSTDIDKAYRLGVYNKKQKRPRAIVVKFVKHSTKERVLSEKRWLAGTKYGISAHIVHDLHDNVGVIRKVCDLARKSDSNAKIVGEKIKFNGGTYAIDSIHNTGLKTETIHQKESDTEVHFLGQLSPLSNFYRCQIEHENRYFTSAEHMYQFNKARRYGDVEAMSRIMLSDKARTAKEEGKRIKRPGNLSQEELNKIDNEIMAHTIKLKFTQNQKLEQMLKNTGQKVLYEANNWDTYWGSGVGLFDKDIFIKQKTGKNFLGNMLMVLREELVNK